MTLLRNKKSFLDSIYSFKLGLFNTISEASRILRIRLFSGAANKILQENLWLKFSFKCFAGLESLEIFSCSSHRSSTLRLVSPMYVCSQTHTPSYMTHDGCGFLLFSLKLFDLLCNPFYSNFVWIVGKFMKLFDETFWKCFISGTIRNIS